MMNGRQYRESLDDGRVTYFEGRRIDRLADEPVFQPVIDSIAATYDKHVHDGAVNAALAPPTSEADLREHIDTLLESDVLLNVTFFGQMALLTAAGKLAKDYPELAERIYHYTDATQHADLRVTECITDAKGDRAKSPSAQPDPEMYVRVVSRGADGVVIRGAKLHITAASFCHHLIVMPTKAMKAGEEAYAIACAVPVNSPGVRIIDVTTAPTGADTRHYPASRRKHMPDGFVILDDVFVPNEHIFLDGQLKYAASFAHSLGLWERLGGTAQMVRQADELVGMAQLIAEANGLARASHVRDKIAEMLIHATMLRAGLEAAIMHSEKTEAGFTFPNELFTNAAKYQGAANFSLMVRHLHDIAGGSVVTAPSIADLENPDVGAQIRKYMTGAGDADGTYRTRLFHAIRDVTADSLGGWHHVTNVQSGGGLVAQRLVATAHYDLEGAKKLALEANDLKPLGSSGH